MTLGLGRFWEVLVGGGLEELGQPICLGTTVVLKDHHTLSISSSTVALGCVSCLKLLHTTHDKHPPEAGCAVQATELCVCNIAQLLLVPLLMLLPLLRLALLLCCSTRLQQA